MPDQFDPYSQWLGIVEPHRPVNYYVLLGVAPSESDPQKIAQAADMLAARVRRIRPGPYLAQWSALLDEIAAAKACLTDPAARRHYDASLTQQPLVQQGVGTQGGNVGLVGSGGVYQPSTPAGPPGQPFAAAQPSEDAIAQQEHQLQAQHPTEAGWTSAGSSQPIPGQTFGAYAICPQASAATAGPTHYGAAPGGQAPAEPPLWYEPHEDAGQVRAPFAVGYTQAPVYVTTPQPTPPPSAVPVQSVAPGLSSAPALGGYGVGNLAAPGTYPAGQPNADSVAGDAGAAPLSAVGQATQSSSRSSGLRVIAGLLLVVLIALLCATVYELAKRNGMFVAGGAQDTRTRSASGSGQSDANGGNGQGRPVQTAQTPGGQSTAGVSPANGQYTQGEDPTNLGQTAQSSGDSGSVSASAGTDNGTSGSKSPKMPSEKTGGNNGKSPTGGNNGGNNTDKPPTGVQPPQSAPDDPQKRAVFSAALEKAKLAMQDRDLATARTHLKTAAANAQNDADRDRLVRVETILANLEEFWNLLREAVSKLPAPGELKVRDTYVAIVDNSRNGIIVRAAGRNLSYTIEQMPITLIMAIVEHSFQKTAETKVLLGTFLAIEPGADRAAARRLLQEAARSGRNVDAILTELNLSGVPASGGPSSRDAGSSGDLAAKIEAVVKQSSSAKTSAEQRDVAVAALTLLEQALKEKKFEEARRLADVALSAARASNNPTLMRQAAAAKQNLSNLPER